jgi:NADH-quinone oxidoreductase subunit E
LLTAEETRDIEEELKAYPLRRAGVIEALKVVQKRRGWVSDESVRDVAGLLNLSPEEVDGVATFYNLIFRRRVGRHVVLLCDSVSCWVMGYEGLREHLAGRLGIRMGETTSDDRFTLLPIVCLGACDVAPAMMVDDDLHGNLTPEKIDEILDRYP